jgi:antitoxin CptB
MTDEPLSAPDPQRLHWQCRRGMLELDLILSRFLTVAYRALDAEDKTRFARLLEEEDQVLHRWFMGASAPLDDGMRDLVERIRAVGG